MATNSFATGAPAPAPDPAQDHLSLGRGVARSALIGVAIGFLAMATLATTVACIAGLDLVEALGVGSFTALWGGPGFGAMFGAIAAITRNEQLAATAPTATEPG